LELLNLITKNVKLFLREPLGELSVMNQLFQDTFITQKKASFPSHEFKGPFSELAQKIQTDQLEILQICLGKKWFARHANSRIRSACAMIFIKEMSIDNFMGQARELKASTVSMI